MTKSPYQLITTEHITLKIRQKIYILFRPKLLHILCYIRLTFASHQGRNPDCSGLTAGTELRTYCRSLWLDHFFRFIDIVLTPVRQFLY
jgi:hypothetical protein